MNEKLNDFIYSQNSINTYKSCPTKFRYKYIDKINWKKDDFGSREYYESLVTGSEFHLVCERYFSDIPLGVDENHKFYKWIQKIGRLLPKGEKNSSKIYLPEYEIRLKFNGNMITAKYDLVVIDNNNIEIWDWKTEGKKVEYKNVQNRIQTIVYMYMAKEVIPRIHKLDDSYENISMKFYQPEFEDEPVSISYNEEMHSFNRETIEQYINLINNSKQYSKNERHCKYCEFNKLCNNEEVEYSQLEEDIYEC